MKEFFNRMWQKIVESDLPNLLGAIAVLLLGWLIALWLSRKVSSVTHKWLNRNAEKSAEDRTGLPENADSAIGRITYWTVMIFTVLGCMSVLQLDSAAVPLREFITSIAKYLPNIAGAVLLLILARIVAGVVRAVIRRYLSREQVKNSVAGKLGTDPAKTVEYTAGSAYFLVYLFFLPAILNALEIYGITEPLQAMFSVVLVFLPRIVAAGVILLIGFWAARIVSRAVSGAVVLSRLDRLGQICGFNDFSGGGIAKLFGSVAWVLVAIPVVIAALAALKIGELSNSIAGFLDILLNAAGHIIGAVLMLFGAFIAAKFSGAAVARVAEASGCDTWLEKLGLKNEKINAPALSATAGKITMVAVMVLGALAACEILHLDKLSAMIGRFAVFGGNLILSVIVLLIGIALAEFIAGVSGGKLGKGFTCAIKLVVIIFTIALALSNLNIGQSVVEIAFAMLLGAFCIAAGLAFGLGGRDFAAKLLASWQDKRQE